MDRDPVSRAAVTLMLALGALTLARVVAFPLVRVRLADAALAEAAPRTAGPRRNADSLATIVVARDAFRVSRTPAAIAYDALRVQQPDQPLPPKPVLVLTGIAWDRTSPSAILEGVPGVDGPRVVRAGESLNGLLIRTIARDRVIVSGMDTTWTLRVREPWR
jgi:hypothetical protein